MASASSSRGGTSGEASSEACGLPSYKFSGLPFLGEWWLMACQAFDVVRNPERRPSLRAFFQVILPEIAIGLIENWAYFAAWAAGLTALVIMYRIFEYLFGALGAVAALVLCSVMAWVSSEYEDRLEREYLEELAKEEEEAAMGLRGISPEDLALLESSEPPANWDPRDSRPWDSKLPELPGTQLADQTSENPDSQKMNDIRKRLSKLIAMSELELGEDEDEGGDPDEEEQVEGLTSRASVHLEEPEPEISSSMSGPAPRNGVAIGVNDSGGVRKRR